MSNKSPDAFDWLGIRKKPDFTKARGLGHFLGWCVLALVPLTILATVYTLGRVFWQIATPEGETLKDMGYVLLGLLGAPFVVWRAIIAQKQATTAEQGLITDRINKAVAGLGAEKTVKRKIERWSKGKKVSSIEEVTEPNIEVRIGAIYSLERIAQDSERDHIQIMEILCAYIRENAPASTAQDHGFGEWKSHAFPNRSEASRKQTSENVKWSVEIHKWVKALKPPRPDIQTALEVIGRRNDSRIRYENERQHSGKGPYTLDLRRTNLQVADLSHLKFQNASLEGARLEGADLSYAELQSVNFTDAKLTNANLLNARLKNADFSRAYLEGSDLRHSELQGAVLSVAKLQLADLRHAELEGADFLGAQLQHGSLSGAKLQGVVLYGTKLSENTDFSPMSLLGASLHYIDLSAPLAFRTVTPDQLLTTFGDRSVILPDDVAGGYPAHWAQEAEPLEQGEFRTRWRAFQASIGYRPPQNQPTYQMPPEKYRLYTPSTKKPAP